MKERLNPRVLITPGIIYYNDDANRNYSPDIGEPVIGISLNPQCFAPLKSKFAS